VTCRVVLEDDAEQDIAAIADWYREHAPEQVDRFESFLDEAMALLADNPLIAAPRRGRLRRRPLEVFPYDLWYATDGRTVFIARVFHQRRDESRIG